MAFVVHSRLLASETLMLLESLERLGTHMFHIIFFLNVLSLF